MRKFANQTAQNVTFLLDHLLHQYDNSLRPDIRGILLRPQFSTNPTLENPLKNRTSYLLKGGFLSGFSKVGFKENYGHRVAFFEKVLYR